MKKSLKSKELTQKLIILGVLVFLFLFFTVMKKGFASYLNIMTIALSTCVNGLLALGLTFCITTAGIDLSSGTTMTFSAVMSGISFTVWGFPIWLSIIFGFFIGGLCGAASGFGVAKMKLPPFIATLSMQMMTKGLSLVVSGIKPIYFTNAPEYQNIALGGFLGINGFYNAFVLYIIGIVIA